MRWRDFAWRWEENIEGRVCCSIGGVLIEDSMRKTGQGLCFQLSKLFSNL